MAEEKITVSHDEPPDLSRRCLHESMKRLEDNTFGSEFNTAIKTNLIPLWLVPYFFCLSPAGSGAIIDKTLPICYERFIRALDDAVLYCEIRHRDPITRMYSATPMQLESLFFASDLDMWAYNSHGLRMATPPEEPSIDGFVKDKLPALAPAPDAIDRPLRNIERQTLLIIIAALASEAKIDITRHEAAGSVIEKLTDELGSHLDAGTIARHLKRCPEAINDRKK
ncbi:hypothetical protein [Thiocystis violascens]|uniref:Uncharacterized protein n=1 Tax=Thiocystis violascens (strain ATCC 17096 / DSM 198 / 6111) TaxID=765911 RepID=I3YBE0_THIV6|nr:hypothetical protein [Thiocystis violascens]AFL74308.1 hypothetical protein Thivi_2363 [Thiocystis violascens DSM 198]